MPKKENSNVHLALAHFPVYDKNGRVVTSSVTTLDVHDISRICKTFDIATFYIVTPLKAQKNLLERMIKHWLTGYGAKYNPTRKDALQKTSIRSSLDQVVEELTTRWGKRPRTIVTDAKWFPNSTDHETLKRSLESNDHPFLIIFGTGWGLEEGIVKGADYVLDPIEGCNGYNHLPVRAAIAIILDRLLAEI